MGEDMENVISPERSNAIKECARYFMCREGSKQPIKKADIVKYISTLLTNPSNTELNSIIAESNKILDKIYGCKWIQVDSKGGAQYMVVLTEECQSLPSPVVSAKQRMLLTAALTHIYMNGGSVKEEEMWKFLDKAGLLCDNDQDKKILTHVFTKQLYLVYSKETIADCNRFKFEWGQRAAAEFPKMFLMKKMAEAFEKSPDYWSEQYKEAAKETQEEPITL